MLKSRQLVREESMRRKQFTVQSKEWTIKGAQEASSGIRSPITMTKQSHSPKPWETDKTMTKILKKYQIPSTATDKEDTSVAALLDALGMHNLNQI